MLHFKANNECSKYAYEIARLLVHQFCILSEKEACEEFFGMFVNTTGKENAHIPCDLKMEHIVKDIKSNIKHMFSNKTDQNITNRSSALPVIKAVSEAFDDVTGVIIRSKRHTRTSSLHDEAEMIKDIHQIQPFVYKAGRKHLLFPNVPKQMTCDLDEKKYHTWIETQKYKFATDLGN
ncbi:hypothetical protein DPMN_037834 [Dreissena polymorpha]|uniref:DUF6589 domain-containing protein n=1 Tax=Dreissena polymorpha TaxID=45954 RepID=A0A9D4MFT9_DREPO|nr:hypothetical protein DPMN_037834 [Dreissena polymorpha]